MPAPATTKLYEQLADEISSQIRAGVLRPGDRLPSVRVTSRGYGVNPGTVLQAYGRLEDRGQIRARPRSGYYVTARREDVQPEPETLWPPKVSTTVNTRDLIFDVLNAIKSRNVVPFGSAFPSPDFFPFAELAKSLHAGARRLDPYAAVEHLPPGNLDLIRQIARRYMESGVTVRKDEIVITCGAIEGLNLCLQAVAQPGDVIAIESPTFYLALEAIERMKLKAVEIATHPREGVDLSALSAAFDRHPIKVCWVMTNFQNPMGSLMPEGKKRELVRMLAERDVPLIEDDVYAELYFGADRPKPAKAFDRKGLVLHCSSFSKCLAPGYRVGWAAAGRFADQVNRGKLMTSIATSIPIQAGIAEHLKHGGYERHLRRLRHSLAIQQGHMLQAIKQYFPTATRVTRPEGGYFLWVELPESVNALDVHRLAIGKKITIVPGPIFSARKKYGNCIRLNYGLLWSPRMEVAMATLGEIVTSLC